MIRLVLIRTIPLALVLLSLAWAAPASAASAPAAPASVAPAPAAPASVAPAPPEPVVPEMLWLASLSACSGECIGPNEIPPVQIACDFQDPPLTAQQCCTRARQLACPAGYTFQGSCYDPSVEIAC